MIYQSFQMCIINLNLCFRHLAYRQIFLQICVSQGCISNNTLHLQCKVILIMIIKLQKRASTFFGHSTVTCSGHRTQLTSSSAEYTFKGLSIWSPIFSPFVAVGAKSEPFQVKETLCIPCSIAWRKHGLGMIGFWETVPEAYKLNKD